MLHVILFLGTSWGSHVSFSGTNVGPNGKEYAPHPHWDFFYFVGVGSLLDYLLVDLLYFSFFERVFCSVLLCMLR